jgi:hypothetical protein
MWTRTARDVDRRRFVFRQRRALPVEPQPDGVPKSGLFTEPIAVTRLDALESETLDDGRRRATFVAEVRDADGRRCPDVAVEATVSGPERTRKVAGNTDMLGRIRFRMAGPPGAYAITLVDVGAGGLAWDAQAGPREASVTVD